MMTRRSRIAALAAVAAIPLAAACTPEEVQRWQAWHTADPAAAEAFINADDQQVEPAEPDFGVWDQLADCESGGDWGIDTGNGYYGGLQFSLSSWRAVGGTGYPHEHDRAEQIRRAEVLLDQQGWGAWPSCARRLGLR